MNNQGFDMAERNGIRELTEDEINAVNGGLGNVAVGAVIGGVIGGINAGSSGGSIGAGIARGAASGALLATGSGLITGTLSIGGRALSSVTGGLTAIGAGGIFGI